MALDIRGSLKNTRVNANRYVVIDELFSNAIDSFLIRQNQEPSSLALNVSFNIEFFQRNLDGSQSDLKITCTDNGAGFGDDQVKAFVTKDTTFKDDLLIEGVGKCKGLGRIQFLHYFNKISIESIFKSDDVYKRRKLYVDSAASKEIDENSFTVEDVSTDNVETTFSLDVIKPEVYERFFANRDLRADFSADALRTYVMVNALHRLVSLKDRLGNFEITFKSKYKEQEEEAILVPADLPKITAEKEVRIHYKSEDGAESDKSETFLLSHYKLSKAEFKLRKNFVALCAKSSAVKIITPRYLKTKTLENNDIAGFYHIILIESPFLDDTVNEQRDNFDLPENSEQADLYLKNLLSFDQIYEKIDDVIHDMLTPPDWDREVIVKGVKNKFGITSDMISGAKVRVQYGDTEEKVVKRVLDTYQEKIIKDTSEIFDIKEEISRADPTSPEFREKVNELAWKYTSSLKSIDMANLSQLVVRRAAVLEILDLAINKNLNIQVDLPDGQKRYDEKIIHNIFFPMGKDNKETGDHDIWLLSEEYHYFDYICSDKMLSKIRWDEDNFLFENDIDAEMEKLLKKNYEENSAKRPDIAVFTKEGAAIIIEFKSPDASLDEHIGDLMEYSQLLAAKSNGRLKRFFGYLVGTHVNPNRLTGYNRFPSGKGWFNTEPIMQHDTGARLGELYSEILYYPDVVERATKRLDVYKQRLNLNISSDTKKIPKD